MEAGLRHDRHREPHALRAVGLEHAPARDIAEPLRPAANHAFRVDGADAADNPSLVADQEAVVGLGHSPVLQERLGPLLGLRVRAQMLGEELAERGQILSRIGSSCRQGHVLCMPFRADGRARHGQRRCGLPLPGEQKIRHRVDRAEVVDVDFLLPDREIRRSLSNQTTSSRIALESRRPVAGRMSSSVTPLASMSRLVRKLHHLGTQGGLDLVAIQVH